MVVTGFVIAAGYAAFASVIDHRVRATFAEPIVASLGTV